MYKEQFEIVTSTSEINWYMISINEAMMSLLNKCDIDYKSLQDTVLPLWLNKYYCCPLKLFIQNKLGLTLLTKYQPF